MWTYRTGSSQSLPFYLILQSAIIKKLMILINISFFHFYMTYIFRHICATQSTAAGDTSFHLRIDNHHRQRYHRTGILKNKMQHVLGCHLRNYVHRAALTTDAFCRLLILFHSFNLKALFTRPTKNRHQCKCQRERNRNFWPWCLPVWPGLLGLKRSGNLSFVVLLPVDIVSPHPPPPPES